MEARCRLWAPCWLTLALFLAMCAVISAKKDPIPLHCYQCVRYNNEECGNESLQACPPSKDRCVTHISKDPTNGFTLKRECGLGPCGFDDQNVVKGLGMDNCDRSKDEYFCIFCCSTDGCNKSGSISLSSSTSVLLLAMLLLGAVGTLHRGDKM